MLRLDGFVTLPPVPTLPPWTYPSWNVPPRIFSPAHCFTYEFPTPTSDNFPFGLYSLSILDCFPSDFSPYEFFSPWTCPPFFGAKKMHQIYFMGYFLHTYRSLR